MRERRKNEQQMKEKQYVQNAVMIANLERRVTELEKELIKPLQMSSVHGGRKSGS